MAGHLKKFRVHGAYKKKSDAKRKEKSDACEGRCFVLSRKVRGHQRFLVLERR
jgi:hypothetical protein